jgi:flagellar basal-body rod modification protein FlgD
MPAMPAIPNDIPNHNQVAERNVRGGNKTLSKDDFLKIMMEQMKKQDPMKPFDSAQMMQQMATLTSLTASEELQKSIQGLGVNIAKSQAVTASQMIGKKVQVPAEVSPLTSKDGVGYLGGSVVVPASATNVTITIKDKDGKVVKTINKGGSTAGVVDFDWDGKDANDALLPNDFYKISAKAVIGGKERDIPTCGTFQIDSVAMNPANGAVFLNINGLGGIDLGDVIKIL